MKTVKNKKLGLQGKRLMMISLLFLLVFESFGSSQLANLDNAIRAAAPHHNFLVIFIALFLMFTIWQFFSLHTEEKSFKKLRSFRSNLRRFRMNYPGAEPRGIPYLYD